MDRSAALRPLEEASEVLRRLDPDLPPAHTADMVRDAAAAVGRSLHLLAGTDEPLPFDERLRRARTADLISIETAGTLVELRAAADRARRQASWDGDGEVARRAVARLRDDLEAAAPAPAETAPESAPAARIGGSGRWMAWLGAVVALLMMVGLAWVLTRGGSAEFERGVAAFRAERWDSAAAGFERVLVEYPTDVTSMLYLARTYRRQGRMEAAAETLRHAVRVAPSDADVRRELGHLFKDLGRPEPAIRQYEAALEHDPDAVHNWASVIRALRATGDPRAERLMDDAPPAIRAALARMGR